MINVIFRTTVVAICLLFLATCNEEEFPTSPYPRIETLGVTNSSSTGVKFTGNVIQLGEKPLIDHGFVWGFEKTVSLGAGNEGVVSLGSKNSTGEFTAEVITGFYKDKIYYVKAYVRTDSYKIYGEAIEFKCNNSAPQQIINIEPMIGTWGDTVTIVGKFFGPTPATNIVKFGTVAAKVIVANETKIVCIVPSDISALTTTITIKVRDNVVASATPFEFTIPQISNISPGSGTFLDEVTINGANFGKNVVDHDVTFDGHIAEVIQATKTSLKVKVPAGIEHKINKVKVTYHLQTAVAPSDFQILPPSITSLSKASGRIGDEIEINGQNFSPRLQGNEVKLGEIKATVVAATKTSLKVKIEHGIYGQRIHKVSVTVAEQTAVSDATFSLIDAWLLKGLTPTAEIEGGGFVIDGVAYFVAGGNFYSYNATTNVWTKKADFPGVFRFDQSSFESNGFGYSGLGSLGCCPGGPSIDFWRYSPASDSWVQRSDFLYNSSVVATGVDGKGYAVDGFGEVYAVEYDPGTNSWQQIGNTLNSNFTGYPHHVNSAFALGDRLFTFLRHSYDPVNNYLFEFNLSTGNWTKRAELREDQMEGFTINGVGYIKGFRALHKYNLATNQFTPDVTPLAKGYFGMVYVFTVNDKAYFLGMWENSHYEFWEFDPSFL